MLMTPENSTSTRPYLRARRRVRQRVDAGEPRNSYSSIPGFSFRSSLNGRMPFHQTMTNNYGSPQNGFFRPGFGFRDKIPSDPRIINQGFIGHHGVPGFLPRHHHFGGSRLLPPSHINGPFGPFYGHQRFLQTHNHQDSPPFFTTTKLMLDGNAASPPATSFMTKEKKIEEPEIVVSKEDEDEASIESGGKYSRVQSAPERFPEEEGSDDDGDGDDKKKTNVVSDSNTTENSLTHSKSKSKDVNLIYFESLGHAHECYNIVRDLLHGKLALAAAAYTKRMDTSTFPPGLLGPSDFRLNNNNEEIKDNVNTTAFMAHLLKVRNEMAINMAAGLNEEPMDLQANKGASLPSSSADEADMLNAGAGSPRSTSSGLSSSSAGKETKTARLENIVSSMRFSPVPPAGCKKRKLYQPMQHEAADPKRNESEESIEENIPDKLEESGPELKKKKDTSNEENEDPEESAPLPPPLIPHPGFHQPPPGLGLHYMEMAKKFLQDQQDKATKECITKDILDETIAKNNSISNKLVEISPDLQGLAEILKSEITASLAVIVESIVGRYLHARRTPLGPKVTEDKPEQFFPSGVKTTHSGRAPQVRDRAVSRSSNSNPLSVSNPLLNSNSITSTTAPLSLPLPPSLRPAPVYSENNSLTPREEDEDGDSSTTEMPEQDEALSLVVTPKKPKRHKVTDTRITPRTVSRVLNQEPYGLPFPPPPPPMSMKPDRPIFPGLPLPTSVAVPNPSLGDFHRFNNFIHSSLAMRSGSPPSADKKDRDSPIGSPEIRHYDRDSVDPSEEFDRIPSGLPFLSGYSMESTHSSTLTPMHLRKAKLMFFWVRYPSSAILKMYFPDIKFNKNNTAQLVKWFSNFREFFYIQMEKYARQSLSEGIKNSEDLHVTVDSELYRVINLHYNRNNHIEVPSRFRWVIEQTLCEFFKAIQIGKDADPSWKKQIYKVISRLDDYVPDYFKSQTFLEQLD